MKDLHQIALSILFLEVIVVMRWAVVNQRAQVFEILLDESVPHAVVSCRRFFQQSHTLS